MRLLRRIAREERGAMAITVALLLPALLGVGALAVDVGNWYVHKRELQTQADAAALAGAAYFKYPCVDEPISDAAESYAGKDRNVFSNVPSARSTFLLNAKDFSGQVKPGDTDVSGSPCADGAVDVKMTEKDVPGIFGKLFAPFINAQARVNIRRLEQLDGLLPVGVPVPDPKRVRVTFISESTGEELGHKDLCEEADAVSGLQMWDNASSNAAGWNGTTASCDKATPASSLPMTFNDPKYAKVGVRVQVSGSATAIDCNQPLVSCYDAGSTNGAGFVHSWSDQPAVTDAGKSAPEARSVVLRPGTCGDAYFSAQSAACTIGMRTKVDFQPREYDATGNPRKSGNNPLVAVTAVVTSSSGSSSYGLSWDSASKTWQAPSIDVPPGAGPLNIKLTWEQKDNSVGGNTCSNNNNNPCKGTTEVVQRTFSASDARSGPMKLLQIGDLSNTSGVNDVQRCSSANPSCTTNFVVRVGIGGTLALSKPTDPPTVLRITGGSQTQAIDCDSSISTLKDQIAAGCAPRYARNTGQACPDHSQSATQAAGASWACVWTKTGQSPSQVSAGMNHRILGNEKAKVCTAPNHWPNYDPGDPRIIPVFVVPYGSFKGSGNEAFPVQDFAFFYITGWTGQGNGFDNPCQGQGDDPVPGNDAGVIVGHFIKYVESVNNGGDSGTPCDLSSLSGCVAVMTK
jgi:Putative Flp pilus-assembly TadE/G-like